MSKPPVALVGLTVLLALLAARYKRGRTQRQLPRRYADYLAQRAIDLSQPASDDQGWFGYVNRSGKSRRLHLQSLYSCGQEERSSWSHTARVLTMRATERVPSIS
jgi:hypothetical protein